MNRILVFLACFIAAGCSSLPIASLYPSSPDSSEFKLISAKVIGDKCFVGFSRDGLLFFVSTSSASRSFDLNVYDSRTGLVSTHGLETSGRRTCSDVRLSYTTTIIGDELRYVSDSSVRKNLDQYHLQPEGFWRAISALQARYGTRHRWEQSEQTMYLQKGPRSAGTIANVVSLLKNLSNDEATALVKVQLDTQQKRNDYVERSAAAHRAAQVAYILADQQAKARWEQRMSYRLTVGDRVCTYATNSVGDVEALANDRVKVHVFGRAAANEPPGVFFSGAVTRKVDLEKTEFPRWFDRGELDKCTWAESI